jgi:hypothetical protein
MSVAPSIPPAPVRQQAPPTRVAPSDSWRSLRDARGALLLTTGTAYHRKESKFARLEAASITLDGMNEH